MNYNIILKQISKKYISMSRLLITQMPNTQNVMMAAGAKLLECNPMEYVNHLKNVIDLVRCAHNPVK